MKKMSIGRQFLLLVMALAAFTQLAGGGLVLLLRHNAAVGRGTAQEGVRRTGLLFSLVKSASRAQKFTQQLLRERDPDNIERLLAQSKAAQEAAARDIRQAGGGSGDIQKLFDAVGARNAKALEFLLRGDDARAQEIVVEESDPAFEGLIEAIDKQRELAGQQEVALAAEIDASSQRTQTIVSLLTVAVIAGLIAFAVIRVRRIGAVLEEAVDALTAASNGAAAAAQQISQSSQVVSEGASQQAASLEETSASSAEISSMTRGNADHSEAAAEKMQRTAHQVGDVNARLDQLVVSMEHINSSGGKVGKIIRTIDEIAFQTNILALNAAVEAARAGESGLGFAVVADEVRSLAQRCSRAANDTTALIEASISSSKEGKIRLDQVAESVRDITASTQEVKILVDGIRASTAEQTRGIEQVNRALAEMERVTQQTAAAGEESATVSQELLSQSHGWERTVTHLASLVHGEA